ncbi:MAG TPA: DUF2600 family protein [Solirubrobacterales bacterium]
MKAAAREVGAAAGALGAYVTTVMPRVRSELRRWGPLLPEKAANAEAVSVFATLAPRSARPAVVRAIAALQVAIDLRDTLEEAGESEAKASDRLAHLETAWREEVAGLPSYPAVAELLERAVGRCAEGQRRTHAAARQGPDELRRWAEGLGAPSEYRWWEVAAGASSSVAAHALISAAADPATSTEVAAQVDAAYHPPIGALTVLLDDLVDLAADRAGGEHSYLAYYGDGDEAAERLGLIADRAEDSIERLPHARRHQAILAGVAAYYLSSKRAETEMGRAIRAPLLNTVGPGATILTSFLSLRRIGKRKRSG